MNIATIKNEKIGNKEILVTLLDGLYTIIAYENGLACGSYATRDKEEAIETYQLNVWKMCE